VICHFFPPKIGTDVPVKRQAKQALKAFFALSAC
jgi:hypothetical protein